MTGPDGRVEGSPAGSPDAPQPAPSSAMTRPLHTAHTGEQPGQGATSSAGQGVPSRPSPLPPPRQVPAGTQRQQPTGARPGSVVPPATGPTRAAARPAPPGRGRRARLLLRRLDPWSVFLTSLVLSICLGIMTIVAAFVLYAVLDGLGVPSSINKLVETLQGGQPVLTRSRFVGGAAVLAAVNVVLLSILATLGALLYNVVATFTGGVEVTLNERD